MKKLLAQRNWWTLNKEITRHLGSLEASLILTMLCDKHDIHPEKEMIFLRIKEIEDETGMTYHRINKALTLLETSGFIFKQKEKKLNPVMMYKVFEDKIVDLLRLNNSTSCGEESGTHNKKAYTGIRNKEKKGIGINNMNEYIPQSNMTSEQIIQYSNESFK
jgi:predicted transcriptional regulator